MSPQAVGGECYYIFTMSRCPEVCPVTTSTFFRFARITQMKFRGGHHYRQQMSWLHVGRYCARDKWAGYDRKFESTYNRCWQVANDFTHCTVYAYGTLLPHFYWRLVYIAASKKTFKKNTDYFYAVRISISIAICLKFSFNLRYFLSRVSILTRDIDIANLSVCPSVTFWYQMKTA